MNIRKSCHKKSISGIISSLIFIFQLILLINGAAIAQQDDSLYVGKTWQISRGLDFANHQYTDIPVYNCNGSKALFMGRKGKFYISTSLNSTPTLIKFPEQPKGKLEWDKKKPEILYYLTYKKDITRVHQFNVESEEDKIIYTTENDITEISPTHPDGDHLLLAPKDQANSVMEIYSLSKGESIKIPMDVPLHRVRFTTSPDLTVYVNRSGKLLLPKTSWLVDPQTKKKRQVYQGASTSPNWRIGGNNFCFYGTYNGARGLLVLDTNGTVVKSFPQLTNHHLSWSPDGKYIVTDVEKDPANKKKSMYPGWICVVNYETGEIKNIVEHGSEFDDKEGDKYSDGHPHPQLSPDATKVIYNSTKFGIDQPHVFVSFVKLPESVKIASAKREENKIIIEWQNPESKELKGCAIYSINKNGKTELIGSVDLPGTKLVAEYNPDVTGYNIVTKEYSGLTSKPYLIKPETLDQENIDQKIQKKGKKSKIEKVENQVQKKAKKSGGKKTIEELIAMNPPVKYEKGFVGKKYPPEWKEFPSMNPNFKVLQLTTSPAEDSKFYLTTDSYYPALNSVAFVSNRTGTWNVFYCSLDNGVITQVTDFPKSIKGDGHSDICIIKTNEIVYYNKQTAVLHKVNLVSFKDTELYKLPEGFKLGNSLTANGDGSIIVVTAIKGEKGDVEVSKMIFVNTDGSGVSEITRPGQQLSHVNLSTSGKKPGVIYARKEIEDNKMFFYMSLDGKVDKKIIEAKGKDEGVSHPFWTPDGSKACYLKKVRGNDPKFWLGYYDINEDKNYEFEKVQDNDMCANYNSSIFVGTGSAIDPCLKFWRIENGKLVATRMFEHGATFPGPECRDVHNTFIAGTNNVIFNADGDGNGNVYVLIEKK